MQIYKNFFLEAGLNHLGSLKEANMMLNFFLKSKFKYMTFMIHTKEFYKKMEKRINYNLPKSFYKKALKLAKRNNKKIGLSVCDFENFRNYSDLNFDFYKLLGISINKKRLIQSLKKKNKKVYISVAHGSDLKIIKCIKYFGSSKNLALIYTSRSYNPNDWDLNRINYLSKFKIPVGYGHHYKNILPIILSSFFKTSFFFIYIKNFTKGKKLFPDDDHGIFTSDLDKIIFQLQETKILLKKKKTINIKSNIKSIVDKI